MTYFEWTSSEFDDDAWPAATSQIPWASMWPNVPVLPGDICCPKHPDTNMAYFRWQDGFIEFICPVRDCDWYAWSAPV